jgi:hypothetical protein
MKTASFFSAALVLAAVSPAPSVRADHPVIGTWQIRVTESCVETDTFRTDGTTYGTSNEEVSSSRYEISDTPNERGIYVLVDTVVSTNGKPDCTGHKMPIGDVARVYVKFSTTGNGMLICREETMRACFSMKRVRDI